MLNKRKWTRTRFISTLFFKIIKDSNQKCLRPAHEGVVKNMSAGGLFFESTAIPLSLLQKLTNGEAFLQLELYFPGRRVPFVVSSELRWFKGTEDYLEVNRNGFGVRFVDASDEFKELCLNAILAGSAKAGLTNVS